MLVQFLRSHLYQSVIFLSVQFESGSHLYRSVISLSCQFVFPGPHLYQSAIFLSVQFESGLHLYQSVIRRASLSWGRTYIDRPYSYHFSCLVWVGTAPISIGHCLVGLSWDLFTSELRLHSWVLFDFWVTISTCFDVQGHFSAAVSFRVIVLGIHIHWRCTPYLH